MHTNTISLVAFKRVPFFTILAIIVVPLKTDVMESFVLETFAASGEAESIGEVYRAFTNIAMIRKNLASRHMPENGVQITYNDHNVTYRTLPQMRIIAHRRHSFLKS